jgi:hypothetical protein
VGINPQPCGIGFVFDFEVYNKSILMRRC